MLRPLNRRTAQRSARRRQRPLRQQSIAAARAQNIQQPLREAEQNRLLSPTTQPRSKRVRLSPLKAAMLSVFFNSECNTRKEAQELLARFMRTWLLRALFRLNLEPSSFRRPKRASAWIVAL